MMSYVWCAVQMQYYTYKVVPMTRFVGQQGYVILIVLYLHFTVAMFVILFWEHSIARSFLNQQCM